MTRQQHASNGIQSLRSRNETLLLLHEINASEEEESVAVPMRALFIHQAFATGDQTSGTRHVRSRVPHVIEYERLEEVRSDNSHLTGSYDSCASTARKLHTLPTPPVASPCNHGAYPDHTTLLWEDRIYMDIWYVERSSLLVDSRMSSNSSERSVWVKQICALKWR